MTSGLSREPADRTVFTVVVRRSNSSITLMVYTEYTKCAVWVAAERSIGNKRFLNGDPWLAFRCRWEEWAGEGGAVPCFLHVYLYVTELLSSRAPWEHDMWVIAVIIYMYTYVYIVLLHYNGGVGNSSLGGEF